MVLTKKGGYILFRLLDSNIRTYQGIARLLRLKIVFAVAFALIYGSIILSIGFLLNFQNILPVTETYVTVGLLFVIGMVLNGWLVLRLMRQPLNSIEKIENRLVRMIENGDLNPEDNHIPNEFRSTPFLTALYGLLEHLDTIESRHLEFLAKVAHDIRSPVATILGYAELLTDSSLRSDENFAEEAFAIIRKQGNRVCRLVEEAVMAAEIDAGRIPLQYDEVELDELLSYLIEDARKQYQRQIRFENHTGKVKIQADALSLRTVILNLVDNAVKYSAPDQEVLLSLEHSDPPDGIEIRVRDFGIGIPDEDKLLLFRRFGRIQKDGHREKQGAGLGLYLSQRIVQKHAGRIMVDSKPGAGSTFTVWLPLDNGFGVNQST